MQNMFKTIGSRLFLIGILIAVIVGIIFAANEAWLESYSGTISTLLALLGFVVGILSFFAIGNITQERVPTFLIAALLLVGIGASAPFFKNIELVGTYLSWIAGMLAVFVAPAAGLLAIRAIWDSGKTEDIEKVIPKMPESLK